MVTKPTPGATGWNVAVDEVIDIANSVADLPSRVAALEGAGGDVTEAELAAGLATKAAAVHNHAEFITQDNGDNRYILQTVAGTFAPAEATTTALAGKQPLAADLTALAGLDSATAGTVASDGSGWVKKTYAQLKSALALVKGDVGLANVDNTSDVAKPISTLGASGLVSGQRLMPPPKTILSRFALGHAWTGGTDDTTIKLYGDRSYRGTSDGAGANKTLSAATGGANQDWTGYYARVTFRVDDVTKLGTTQLWLDAGPSAAYFAQICGGTDAGNLLVSGQWVTVTLPRAAFSVSGTGTPSWTTITRPRLVFKDRAAGAVTVWLAAVELLPDLATLYPNGVFILEADDGYPAQKTLLRPTLDALGVPCTFNPIVERITNNSAGMTVADLRDMQDLSGWQISAHAYAQTFHDTAGANAATAAADFAANKAWMHNNGFHAGADDYSLCPGTGTPATLAMKATLGCYWRSARMSSGYFETVIPSDPLSFKSLLFAGSTVSQLQTNIDQAAGPGGVFHLSVHDVLAGATNGTSNGLQAIAVDNLRTVVQYALSKGMVARTRADWLALL